MDWPIIVAIAYPFVCWTLYAIHMIYHPSEEIIRDKDSDLIDVVCFWIAPILFPFITLLAILYFVPTGIKKMAKLCRRVAKLVEEKPNA